MDRRKSRVLRGQSEAGGERRGGGEDLEGAEGDAGGAVGEGADDGGADLLRHRLLQQRGQARHLHADDTSL